MLKKLAILMLVVALSLSLSVTHAATVQNAEDKAVVLNQLGLFLGIDPDVFTPGVAPV